MLRMSGLLVIGTVILFSCTMSVSYSIVGQIFISSFSGITKSGSSDALKIRFQRMVDRITKQQMSTKKLIYVPTASYYTPDASNRSPGEHRRRARYDAKQKLKLIGQYFDIPEKDRYMLELDHKDVDRALQKLFPASVEDSSISSSGASSSSAPSISCVYVDGGNTFYLQKHIIESRLWSHLQQGPLEASMQYNPIDGNGVIYIGSSAGAIVAGKIIATAYWKGWDDPCAAGDDFVWTDDRLTGAGITDCNMFMHYDEQQHLELVTKKCLASEKLLVIPDNIGVAEYPDEMKQAFDCDGNDVNYVPLSDEFSWIQISSNL